MKTYLIAAAAGLLAATSLQAQGFTDAVIEQFRAQGFTNIEIKNGPTQTKVEALRGTTKVEVVYDRATGSILKQENERTLLPAVGGRGVEIRQRDRDFLDVSGRRETLSSRNRSADDDDMDDDEDDDDRRSGRDRDRDDDRDNRRGRGGDDDRDNDRDDDSGKRGTDNTGRGSDRERDGDSDDD